MIRLALIMLAIASTAGCGVVQGSPISKEEIRALSDRESMVLLQCQGQKVYEDLGQEEGAKYMDRKFAELLKDVEEEMTNPDADNDPLLQYELAKDGYYCDEEERQQFVKEQKQAEQEAQWGPPQELIDTNPGLFGGAFVGDVDYTVYKEYEGYWMGIARYKDLAVSTTATKDAEVYKLAEMIKVDHSDGTRFDFVRAGWSNPKDPPYKAAGTIVIINSRDGLKLFADQYPVGSAYEDAKEDFENDDGVVFLPGGV